jgi:hypothetical protein
MHFSDNRFEHIKIGKDELKFQVHLLMASGVAHRRKMVLAFSRALSW